MTVTRIVEIEMHSHPTKWVSNAIPAVLSELYFGYPKRYLTLRSVRERYFEGVDLGHPTADQINPAIRRVAHMDPRRRRGRLRPARAG